MSAAVSSRLHSTPTEKSQWQALCEQGHLYAVVDSCDEPSVAPKAAEVGPSRAVSLYRGSAEERYATIAPYLFHVDQGLFDWIANQIWTSPWGIFVYSESPLEALRTHFRRFLTVKGTDQKKYLLRFYDPRVLPGFLESSNDRELTEFFGPVRGYGAKSGDGILLIRHGGGA